MGFFKNILKEVVFGTSVQESIPKTSQKAALKRETEKSKRKGIFDKIIGHEEVKTLFYKALESNEPVHILLLGEKGTAKSMFMEALKEQFGAYWVTGSNATKAGMISYIFENKPKYICIDELDKMGGDAQESLLNMMEQGIISETKKSSTREIKHKPWVFATANREDILEELQDRFLVLRFEPYSFEEFREIARCNFAATSTPELIDAIVNAVWFKMNKHEFREVAKLARMCKTIEEVAEMVSTMSKYGKKEKVK